MIKDYQETWFYEYYPGKYDKDIFNNDSVYINAGAEYIISDCLHRANNNYTCENNTVYTKEKGQIQLLIEELNKRLAEIIENKDLSGKFLRQGISAEISAKTIDDINKNKKEIIKMIGDMIEWLDNLAENELTIIGTHDKLAQIILS